MPRRTLARRRSQYAHRLWLNRLEDRATPATFIVTSNADSGAGTLRQALLDADVNGQADTITFDAGFSSIQLTSGHLSLANDVSDLSIIGPGAGKLSILGATTAAATNRIFNFAVSGGVAKISIAGLTLSGGNVTAGNNGGAVLVQDETLMLSGMVLSGNKSGSAGGAIATTSAGASLTLDQCILTSNQSESFGGAIYVPAAASVTLVNCTASVNRSGDDGGALYAASGATISLTKSNFDANTAVDRAGAITAFDATLSVSECSFTSNVARTAGAIELGLGSQKATIQNSTFAFNQATTASTAPVGSGGAIFASGGILAITASSLIHNSAANHGGGLYASTTSVTMTNTTLAGNSTDQRGGAVYLNSTAALTLWNSTLAYNEGGGVWLASGNGVLAASSSVIAANMYRGNPNDIDNTSSTEIVAGDNNLIGTGDAEYTFSGQGNKVGTKSAPLDPRLTPFPNNFGGPTLVLAPLGGSPVLENGNNAAGLATDQRGAARTVAVTDIGAVEGAIAKPYVAAVMVPTVYAAGPESIAIGITLSDETGIDASSLGTGDIEVSGPGGTFTPTLIGWTAAGGNSIHATFTMQAVGGQWDLIDNGSYLIRLAKNAVFDTDAIPNATGETLIGRFAVNVGPVVTVDNAIDEDDGSHVAGDLSLREAIALANASVNVTETIRFAAALIGQTLQLNSELVITDPVALQGPGADHLTLSGTGQGRLFRSNMTGSKRPLYIGGLSLTRGLAIDEVGGAVYVNDDALTLVGANVHHNVASFGGAFRINFDGSVRIIDSRVSDNLATTSGGAIWSNSGFVEITRSTLANNVSSNGGGVWLSGNWLRVTDSSMVGNRSSASSGGGARLTDATAIILNSTFSGNSAASNGGALSLEGTSVASLRNATMTGNTGANNGAIHMTGLQPLSLNNTVIAQNVGGQHPDIQLSALTTAVTGSGNIFGVLNGGTDKHPGAFLAGTLAAPLNAGLTPLRDFGGSTRTHGLLPSSPALEFGAAGASAVFDQRGVGFPRHLGGKVDAGASEGVLDMPVATANVPDVTVAGSNVLTVSVTYQDADGIDAATIDINDVVMAGPGFSGNVSPNKVTVTGSGPSITATYEFVPPGGAWDNADNGDTYQLAQLPGQVFDFAPTPQGAIPGVIAHLRVAIGQVIVVDTALDLVDANDGKTSLREAIAVATFSSTAVGVQDVISFSPSLNGTTITLTNGELAIYDPVTIDGPGAKLLTISGNNTSRVFNFATAPNTSGSIVNDLTLATGKSTTDGGAIFLTDTLTLSGVIITGSTAVESGGGIGLSHGVLTVLDCILMNNSATYGGGIGAGSSGSVVNVTRSHLFNNLAATWGGGIDADGDTITLTDSTLSNNAVTKTGSPSIGGGAIRVADGVASILNSTISGNSGYASGGVMINSDGTLLIANSTIARNSAAITGGVRIANTSAKVSILSSIVAENVGPSHGDLETPSATAVTVSLDNSLIGIVSDADMVLTGKFLSGSLAAPLNPRLTLLGNLGGPTPTHGLLQKSPAIDAGSNSLNLPYDQRGVGYPRAINLPDVGATEGVLPLPYATTKLTAVTVAWETSYVATVTYEDETGVDAKSIDINDVRLTGPGFASPVAPTSVSVTGSGASVTATYTFAAPGGFWDVTDNGAYTLELRANEVWDTDVPTSNAVPAGIMGNVTVLVPTQYVVDSPATNDDGKYGVGQLTLNEAVALANNNKGLTDTITFDAQVFPSGSTLFINPTFNITDSLTVIGPETPLWINPSGTAFKVITVGNIQLTVERLSFIDGNTNYSDGGVIYSSGGQIHLKDVTISSSYARDYGGGVYALYGSLLIENCFFTNNQDGAIYATQSNLTVRNSTISGNASSGIIARDGTTVFIENCTITNNKGAGVTTSGTVPTINITSSVVAGNTSSQDIFGSSVIATNCAIGVAPTTGFTKFGGFAGTAAAPFNPMLAALADNGGLSLTQAPQLGSPLIDVGSNPSSLLYDQRGAGYPRVIGAKADIGAFEGVNPVPTAVGGPFVNVNYEGATVYTFTVTYFDDLAIDVASLGTGDVTVTGPGFAATPTFVSVDAPGNGTPRTATYALTPPGGSWDAADNGKYTVSLAANQVADADAKIHTALPVTLGTLQVTAAKQFLVDEPGDVVDANTSVGHLSLREAVSLANQNKLLNDLITFDPLVFAGATTIGLQNGELVVTDGVAVIGPTAGLTLDAAGKSRIWSIQNPDASNRLVTLDGFNMINGAAATDYGGAIYNHRGNLTLKRVTISTSTAALGGGAVYCSADGNSWVSVEDSTVRDNTVTSSTGRGGALNIGDYNSLAQFSRSVFEGNVSGGNGGAISGFATLTADACLFVNNRSLTGTGGAIDLTAGTFTLTNSTISGNTAVAGGGFHASDGTLIIRNCTVAFNLANTMGGGILAFTDADVILESTLVADNAAIVGPDVSGLAQANQSLIGRGDGVAISGTSNLLNVAARLLPLADNGGGSKTHLPAHGSPARDAGANPTGVSADQRGAGYPRVLGAAADIGAVESATTMPWGVANLANVTTTGGVSYSFTVTYRDDVGIDVGSLGTGDVTVTGPNGFNVTPTFVSVDVAGNGSPRTATYQFTSPGGSWDAADIGAYSVAINANEVFDAEAASTAIPGGPLGSFSLHLPRALVVDNGSDSFDGDFTAGQFTLREAVALANQDIGSVDTITFSASAFPGAATIGLTRALVIRGRVSVQGPGAKSMTLNAGLLDRHLLIDVPGSVAAPIAASGLTFIGGKVAGNGGAISVFAEALTITDCELKYNSATKGGAIATLDGTLTILRSRLLQNSASEDGGGIWTNSLAATIIDSTLSGNIAVRGGGLSSLTDVMTIRGSTFDGNTANSYGGGIQHSSGSLYLSNSTLSGNSATTKSGGIQFWSAGSTFRIDNSTITGNSSAKAGGVYSIQASSFTIASSVIAKNTAPTYPDARNNSGGVLVTFSAIGVDNIAEATGSSFNRPYGEDPRLGLLADNGGPTRTHAPLADSPLLDRGSNPTTLVTDQRGSGFARQIGFAPDIGAVETTFTPPTPTAKLDAVNQPGGTSYLIVVTFSDDVAVQFASLGTGDIKVTGPNAFIGYPVLSSVDVAGDGSPRTATYKLTPPGGTWNQDDTGTFTVSLQPSEVFDTAGHAALGDTLGIFAVKIAGNYVVTNTNDAGAGSLRAAIALANGATGLTDTISFDPTMFGKAQTIKLATGQLLVTDPLVFIGPGSTLLTIDGNNQSRVFKLDPPTSTDIAVSMSGVRITKGSATGFTFADGGGGIYAIDVQLTLNDVSLIANTTQYSGGGLHYREGPSLIIENCTFANNRAVDWISAGAAGISIECPSVLIRNSVISANTANSGGGGLVFNNQGKLTIQNCEISNNVANGNSGGGLWIANGNNFLMENTTVSGNVTGTNGGGLFFSQVSNSIIRNSTIYNNTAAANEGGGGINFPNVNSQPPRLQLISTMVTGNVSPMAPDLRGNIVDLTRTMIGNASGFTLGNDGGGNLPYGLNPLLGPLQNNGGPTRTHLPLTGSPAIGAGSNPGGLVFDQRGAFYYREFGQADIGAAEFITDDPVATAVAAKLSTPGGATHTFTVTYYDDVAISVASIGPGDVRVTGPNGFDAAADFVSVDYAVDGTPRTATYKVTAPGGVWDGTDNGTYSVVMQTSAVSDTTGHVVAGGPLTTFSVNCPATYLVTNTDDAGPGSLRAALAAANLSAPVPDAIAFDPVFFSVARTITLTSGPIAISDAVNVIGPGADQLTITANLKSHLFSIDGPGTMEVTISGVRLRAGSFDRGGAIWVNNERLLLTDCVVTENEALSGGAIYFETGGQLVITGCTFTKNTSVYSGGAVNMQGSATHFSAYDTVFANNVGSFGGAVELDAQNFLLIERTAFTNNKSAYGGGGLSASGGDATVTIRDSTFVGNSASNGAGGGLYIHSPPSVLNISNSTFSGNVANGSSSLGLGGGIAIRFATSGVRTMTIDNCTIVGNSATDNGGGVWITANGPTTTIRSSIVSSNIAQLDTADDLRADTIALTNSAIGIETGFALAAASSGNLPFGASLKLAPLADNGGPTLTHALLPGSPCVDLGSNPNSLVFDQRGPGYARTSGVATDIGAFELQAAPAAPPTATVTIGSGDDQRSMVNSLTVAFSQPMDIPNGLAAVLRLIRTGPNGPVGQVPLAFIWNGAEAQISFPASAFTSAGGSLIDGNYAFSIIASQLNSFDGNGDGTAGDDLVIGFHRLFGDADGDGDVDTTDFGAFRAAFGGSNSVFDFDNDGDVDTTDFGQFRARFGMTI